MLGVLARNWWAFAVRGLLGVLFGVVALTFPGATMLSIVWLFGAYAIADGIFAIIGAVRSARAGEQWGSLALGGVVDIGAGIVAFLWPGLTVVVFVLLIAVWALVSGAFMLAAAAKVDADHGRWWLILGGVASLAYGALLLIAPMTGALVLTWWIGAYAIVLGVAFIFLAFRLRARLKRWSGEQPA
ncbi:membrane protein [Sphingomonas sp. DBB INV C78]|uniref:HdeD family acid-resistance protein n=1 Tax=Sphingomonas sp. DBB INV C78 TaxID=3349434 RepID=UPI0036D37F5F